MGQYNTSALRTTVQECDLIRHWVWFFEIIVSQLCEFVHVFRLNNLYSKTANFQIHDDTVQWYIHDFPYGGRQPFTPIYYYFHFPPLGTANVVLFTNALLHDDKWFTKIALLKCVVNVTILLIDLLCIFIFYIFLYYKITIADSRCCVAFHKNVPVRSAEENHIFSNINGLVFPREKNLITHSTCRKGQLYFEHHLHLEETIHHP